MWSSCRVFLRPRAFPNPLLKPIEKRSCIAKFHFYDHRPRSISSSCTYLNYSGNVVTEKVQSHALNSSSLVTNQILVHRRNLSVGSSDEPAEPPPKLSLYQRFKAMYKDYWYVLIPVHVVTSCAWFGAFFYAARSGFDIAGAIEVLNLSDEIMDKIRSSANSTAGHITLSYLLYKVFTPLRYTVTLGGTTYTIKALTARGLLTKMPKKEELKKMMADKKDSLMDKKDNLTKGIAGKLTATKKNMLPPLEQQKAQ